MSKVKLKRFLLRKHILYGIFVGLLIFLVIKLLFVQQNILKIDIYLLKILIVSLLSSTLIIGLGSFILSKLDIKNELINLIYEIIFFLQNKGLVSLEYKVEKLKNIKDVKNKIFSLIVTLTDKIAGLIKKNEYLENTLTKFTDLKASRVQSVANLRGEIKDVTVLFTDIRNFTPLCEKITSDDIIKFLNSYLNNVTKIIHKYGGVVNKFIGDAVMAIFETSIRIEDEFLSHELRAVSAALEIHKTFDLILEDANIKLLEPIQIGIGVGINSGNAVVGTIGSEERVEFTVVGDVVNIASRLSMMAGIGVTLIGSGTYNKIKDKVKVIETEPISIRGKTGLHNVYILKSVNLISRFE